MNLLTFARRTSPVAFYAIPFVFLWGTASALIDESLGGAVAVLGWGVALFLAYLLGTALHRQKLIVSNLRWWITAVAHNGELGHLPHQSEREAAQWADDIINNPIDQ
jgi:hypothetical protein